MGYDIFDSYCSQVFCSPCSLYSYWRLQGKPTITLLMFQTVIQNVKVNYWVDQAKLTWVVCQLVWYVCTLQLKWTEWIYLNVLITFFKVLHWSQIVFLNLWCVQCNIVCNGTLSLGQGRLVGMHDCSSAPIVLLVQHARAAGTSRDMGTGPTIFWLIH